MEEVDYESCHFLDLSCSVISDYVDHLSECLVEHWKTLLYFVFPVVGYVLQLLERYTCFGGAYVVMPCLDAVNGT